MATSSELYAQRDELVRAKAQFVSNVETFISVCDEAIANSGSIIDICSSSSDTNMLALANTGGVSQRLKTSINNLKEKVNSAKDSACSSADIEIEQLEQAARAAAIREAAAAAAAAAARALANKNVPKKTMVTVTKPYSNNRIS